MPNNKTTPSSAVAQAQLHSFSPTSFTLPRKQKGDRGYDQCVVVSPCCSFLSDSLPLSPVSQNCMEKDNPRTEKLVLGLK